METFVRKAIEEFDTTRKVPQAVVEASIFKKPYFLGQFVPCLVSIGRVEGKDDLFKELVKRGKIPKTILKKIGS